MSVARHETLVSSCAAAVGGRTFPSNISMIAAEEKALFAMHKTTNEYHKPTICPKILDVDAVRRRGSTKSKKFFYKVKCRVKFSPKVNADCFALSAAETRPEKAGRLNTAKSY